MPRRRRRFQAPGPLPTLIGLEVVAIVVVLLLPDATRARIDRWLVGHSQPAPAATTEEPQDEASPPAERQRIEVPVLLEGPRDRRILPQQGNWALVQGPWNKPGAADLHAEPGVASTRLGQALLGDRVKLLELSGDWCRVSGEDLGGQTAWVRTDELTLGSTAVRQAWLRNRALYVVKAPGIEIDRDLFLPFGARLSETTGPAGEAAALLPDGRALALGDKGASGLLRRLELGEALEEAKSFRQIPYRQGANTRRAMDSAGLVFLVFRVAGGDVPRGLEDQRRHGRSIELAEAAPGDILFFSTFDPDRPQPVILLEGGTYLAAAPSHGVALGLVSQLDNRDLVTVRRFL